MHSDTYYFFTVGLTYCDDFIRIGEIRICAAGTLDTQEHLHSCELYVMI